MKNIVRFIRAGYTKIAKQIVIIVKVSRERDEYKLNRSAGDNEI